MRFAKLAVVFGLVLLFAAPVVAANQAYRGECKKLTRQIDRYQRDAKWADSRDDELWEDASRDRVKALAERRADLCPQFRRRNPLAQAADFIAAAAKAAAPYFLPGLY